MRSGDSGRYSEWLVGRKAIADYAKVSVGYVSAMRKAGLKVLAGYRCKPEDVDRFFEMNPKFKFRHVYKDRAPIRLL